MEQVAAIPEQPEVRPVSADEARDNRPVALMTLTALGVVFGDLGTSPLYTLQTIFQTTGGHVNKAVALGVLSLIFWTLLITVSIKYCLFVMRADNHGEGGILALMSLVGGNRWAKGAYVLPTMGLLGAALIYGDGIITPSISVLSAIEGVKVATPALQPFILPVAVAILAALFAVQRFGTASIGKAFGPIMLVWFLVIAALGVAQIVKRPDVLAAVNPTYGAAFLAHQGKAALLVLGAVFLCATGGEALYADMGHVGRFPIRLGWYVLVLPALLLSYAGQTAAVLGHGGANGANPFFMIAPGWAIWPMVVLATLATIIASQAIITGSFSMTRQAMQLGWLPLFTVRQTSDESYGQIYVPVVNFMMAALTIALTLAFRSSEKLAGAYGMAVSTTMLLTTFLLYRAMSKVWRWPTAAALLAAGVFLAVDASFFVANLLKILEGGWIPLTLGALIFLVMITWREGIQAIRARLAEDARPVDTFVAELETQGVVRTPRVAAFLTRMKDKTPPLVAEYVRLTGSLPQTVVALNLQLEEVPRVRAEDRASFSKLSQDFWRVTLRYGFMEEPRLGADLADYKAFGEKVDLSDAIFFGTRDYVTCGKPHKMAAWRTEIFSFLFRNGVRITDRFHLPPERTVEIAREIKI